MDSIETIKLNNVELQANGILRDSSGRLIARLVDSVSYEELKEKNLPTPMTKYIIEKLIEAHTVEGIYGKTWVNPYDPIPVIEAFRQALISTQEERDRSWRERIEGKIALHKQEQGNYKEGGKGYGLIQARINLLNSLLSDTKTNEK